MYCARCRKPISEREPRTWAVLPGGTVPVPTCYDDRTCYGPRRPPVVIKPVVVVKSLAVKSVKFIVSRGRAKYRRRMEFGRWWMR